jgi:hypothetical protein
MRGEIIFQRAPSSSSIKGGSLPFIRTTHKSKEEQSKSKGITTPWA